MSVKSARPRQGLADPQTKGESREEGFSRVFLEKDACMCRDYLLFTQRPESGPSASAVISHCRWLNATVAAVPLQLIALCALGNVGRPASSANEAGGCPAGQVQRSSNAGPHVFLEALSKNAGRTAVEETAGCGKVCSEDPPLPPG